MKRVYGIIIVIGTVIGIVLAQNMELVLSYMALSGTTSVPWLLWAIIAVVAGVLLYFFVAVLIEKYKGLYRPKGRKLIPQPIRIKMVKDFADKWWLTKHAMGDSEPNGHGLTLVEIRTNPTIKDAEKFEAYFFTSDRVPLDRRVGYNYEISVDKRFFFEIDCYVGDINPLLFPNPTMEDAYNFSERKFLQSIPKEIKKSVLELQAEKAYAEILGKTAGAEDIEKSKEEKKESGKNEQ